MDPFIFYGVAVTYKNVLYSVRFYYRKKLKKNGINILYNDITTETKIFPYLLNNDNFNSDY